MKDILFWVPFLLVFILVAVFIVYPAYEDYAEKFEQKNTGDTSSVTQPLEIKK